MLTYGAIDIANFGAACPFVAVRHFTESRENFIPSSQRPPARFASASAMPLINWEEATASDLAGFTVDFLRDELAQRNLINTGSKDEIICRILADIAANRAPPLETTAPAGESPPLLQVNNYSNLCQSSVPTPCRTCRY